jgi:hypothetical protein
LTSNEVASSSRTEQRLSSTASAFTAVFGRDSNAVRSRLRPQPLQNGLDPREAGPGLRVRRRAGAEGREVTQHEGLGRAIRCERLAEPGIGECEVGDRREPPPALHRNHHERKLETDAVAERPVVDARERFRQQRS